MDTAASALTVAAAYVAIVAATGFASEAEELPTWAFLGFVVASVAAGAFIARAWALLLAPLALSPVVALAWSREVGHDLADALVGAALLAVIATLLVLAGLGLRRLAGRPRG